MTGRPALEIAARLGYAGRGAVYVIVAGLAVLAALGGGGPKGQKGALQTLLAQPMGGVLLALVAAGLLGFCVWRLLQAFLDADGLGSEPKALVRRGARAVSGVVYAALAVWAVQITLGTQGGGADDQAAGDWTAYLLAKPFGQWLVGAVAGVVAGAGIAMGVRAWTAKFARRLALDNATRRWAVPLGRFGFAARAVVFLLVAAFLVRAALHANAGEAHGLGGALRALQGETYGSVLLGVTALGLLAFGLFQFVVALYRRIDAPTVGEAVEQVGDGARDAMQDLGR